MPRITHLSVLMLCCTVFMGGFLCARAGAEEETNPSPNRLVNLDTAATASKGSVAGSVDVRLLDHAEDIAFTSVNLRYGLAPHLEVGFRGVTGATRTFLAGNATPITYGGRDAEFYGKYDLGRHHGVRLALLAGATSPATPAQVETTGILSVSGEVKLHDRVMAYLNPRAVFIKDNTIVGVGVGTSIRVSNRVHLVGDWTGIVSGDNALSTSDASRGRRDIWGAALRLSSDNAESHFDLDLGYGNATGSTTGTSLTPGLGHASGFYFAIHARR